MNYGVIISYMVSREGLAIFHISSISSTSITSISSTSITCTLHGKCSITTPAPRCTWCTAPQPPPPRCTPSPLGRTV